MSQHSAVYKRLKRAMEQILGKIESFREPHEVIKPEVLPGQVPRYDFIGSSMPLGAGLSVQGLRLSPFDKTSPWEIHLMWDDEWERECTLIVPSINTPDPYGWIRCLYDAGYVTWNEGPVRRPYHADRGDRLLELVLEYQKKLMMEKKYY